MPYQYRRTDFFQRTTTVIDGTGWALLFIVEVLYVLLQDSILMRGHFR